MKTITVTSQAELDALPDKFDELTVIYIAAPPESRLIIRNRRENSSVVAWGNSSVVARENSSVEAWGNSSVVARENSSVVARGNSSVVARENSSVEARGNSSVEAWGNSSVVARENSSVVARENSSVVARENSSVVARENSSVEARGNSSVVARENSSVEARGNSSVEAWGNSRHKVFESSTLKCFSSGASILGNHNSVVILHDCAPDLKSRGNSQVVTTHAFTHDIKSFIDIYPAKRKSVTLYKSVDPTTLCDFYTGKIKYEGVVNCPDFDPNPDRQCGGGLHLSPTPQLALSYNKGTVLVCTVHIDDIVVYQHDITKVRCRKVRVLREWVKGEK